MSEINWHDWFYYDETSPSCLRWQVSVFTGEYYKRVLVNKGDPVVSQSSHGYYNVKLKSKTYLVHRIIYEMFNKDMWEGYVIDHINRDKTDNKIENIRAVKAENNARNRSKHPNNSTGTTGVYFRNSRFPAYIAFWYDTDKRMRQKSFSVIKYGKDEAMRLAIECRQNQIKKLNLLGYGYTETHGE